MSLFCSQFFHGFSYKNPNSMPWASRPGGMAGSDSPCDLTPCYSPPLILLQALWPLGCLMNTTNFPHLETCCPLLLMHSLPGTLYSLFFFSYKSQDLVQCHLSSLLNRSSSAAHPRHLRADAFPDVVIAHITEMANTGVPSTTHSM